MLETKEVVPLKHVSRERATFITTYMVRSFERVKMY